MLTLIVIFGLFFCLFVAFIFGLINAGRKADIGEEKISSIISQKVPYESRSHNDDKLCVGVAVQK